MYNTDRQRDTRKSGALNNQKTEVREMERFYRTLPEITERVKQLMANQQNTNTTTNKSVILNMLEDRRYANSSFMIRRGLYVSKMLSSIPVRIYPGELIIGSLMGVEPYSITETYEERKD